MKAIFTIASQRKINNTNPGMIRMTVMKKMIIVLSALFLAFPLQAAQKKATVDPVARDKAIDAIEAFSV